MTNIRPTETTVPLLHCVAPDETVEFWTALGFETTYDQRKPYLYLAFQWSAIALNYVNAPASTDPAAENTGGCLVMVDSVAPYHETFVSAMRRHYGKVLSKGRPRITRYRPGATRFSIVDPSGNMITVIQRGEPDIDYGGSRELSGLARVLDNARILREFKNDDRAAFRALRSGLRRHGDGAAAVDRGKALAAAIELAVALDDEPALREYGQQLRELTLSPDERGEIRATLADPHLVAGWLE
ncbi:MAG TPA: glyoxalase [Aldersonia sp.]